MDYVELIDEIKHLERQLREARAEARALARLVDDAIEEINRLSYVDTEEE